MISNIQGKYDEDVKLHIYHPRLADVSAEDYTAASFTIRNGQTVQVPFYVCHPLSLYMKVTFWDGVTSLWTFEAGKDPIPVKKIFATPTPVVVEDGAATETEVTEIQVGY